MISYHDTLTPDRNDACSADGTTFKAGQNRDHINVLLGTSLAANQRAQPALAKRQQDGHGIGGGSNGTPGEDAMQSAGLTGSRRYSTPIRGSQFTGSAFTGVLVSNAIAISMDGKGTDLYASCSPAPKFMSELSDARQGFDYIVVCGTLQYIDDWKNLFLQLCKQVGQSIYVDRTAITYGEGFYTQQKVFVDDTNAGTYTYRVFGQWATGISFGKKEN